MFVTVSIIQHGSTEKIGDLGCETIPRVGEILAMHDNESPTSLSDVWRVRDVQHCAQRNANPQIPGYYVRKIIVIVEEYRER